MWCIYMIKRCIAMKRNKLQLYITRMNITNRILRKPEIQGNNQYDSFQIRLKIKVKTKRYLEIYD